ncbi:MAG: LysR substrate-binding domain-containing protein [Nannocystales bacterium]
MRRKNPPSSGGRGPRLGQSGAATLGLVRAGAGLALLPRAGLEGELRRGLVELFPERRIRSADIFVSMPSRNRVPKRVRLLVDGMKEALADVS